MSINETIVEGTLKPDGTLELDQKPNLPPGRVMVRMQPLAALPEGDPFFDMLKGIWAARAQAGLTPRTVEEVEAQRRHLREESENEILEAGRLQEESRRVKEQATGPDGAARMIVALDANVVIYLVEANPTWIPIATARLAASRAAGDDIAFCDAGRLECLIKPLASGNAADVATYQRFFNSPQVKMLPVTAAVWEHAAQIRATFGTRPLDSVHLATAIEHGCGLFLTADAQLARCTAISVEVLI